MIKRVETVSLSSSSLHFAIRIYKWPHPLLASIVMLNLFLHFLLSQMLFWCIELALCVEHLCTQVTSASPDRYFDVLLFRRLAISTNMYHSSTLVSPCDLPILRDSPLFRQMPQNVPLLRHCTPKESSETSYNFDNP